MAAMSGYINSQTWEAWFETYEVSWENTSLIFVLTVALSLAVVITTWMMRDSGYDTNHGHQDQCEIAELQGIQEVNTDEESEQERNDEFLEGGPCGSLKLSSQDCFIHISHGEFNLAYQGPVPEPGHPHRGAESRSEPTTSPEKASRKSVQLYTQLEASQNTMPQQLPNNYSNQVLQNKGFTQMSLKLVSTTTRRPGHGSQPAPEVSSVPGVGVPISTCSVSGHASSWSIEKLLEISGPLPGEARKVPRQVLERTVEKQMTEEQRQAEREAQSEQLAAIFKMMQDQEDKFGQTTIDEIKDQMKLYCG